ncbi:MAG: GYD domain-containing protein [Acidimicrobiales bacterium]
MARYLIHAKYTAQGAAGARSDGYAVRQAEGSKAFESVGGKVESWLWLDWGEWDFAVVVDAPTSEALLRIAALSAASGAFARTTSSEIFESATMDRAAAAGADWRPPGAAS